MGLQGNAADKIQCVLPQQSPSTWGRQTRSSREAKVNVCPCLPCQWGRMPLIIGEDKWLSRANPKLNKWLLCLFAQGFLHNKTGWEDAKGLSPILLWLCLPSIVATPVRFTKSQVFCPRLGSNNKANLVLSPLMLKSEVKRPLVPTQCFSYSCSSLDIRPRLTWSS